MNKIYIYILKKNFQIMKSVLISVLKQIKYKYNESCNLLSIIALDI